MSNADEFVHRADAYLEDVCSRYPDRHVGGPGNNAATDLFERVAKEAGFDVRSTEFDCVEWVRGSATLEVGAEEYEVFPGPYSLPFGEDVALAADADDVDAAPALAIASSVDELESGDFSGTVLMLAGELVREQLMPKGFAFFNPEPHRRIIAALEARAPAAIVAATGHNPGLAGGSYPFPLIEDADFDIPNAYMTDVDGARLQAWLATHAGARANLRIDSGRRTARARQLVARKSGAAAGAPVGRVVVSGHIDSKAGTPGALDNATGVVALLLLAELLSDYAGALAVELVPFNGEDYYAAPGQVIYLSENANKLDDILLAMNVDGAGYAGVGTDVSLYGEDEAVRAVVMSALAKRDGFAEGKPWPQGDHSLFVMAGRPAVAVTSANFVDLCTNITHTERDVPELVDPAVVVEVARFFADVIEGLNELGDAGGRGAERSSTP